MDLPESSSQECGIDRWVETRRVSCAGNRNQKRKLGQVALAPKKAVKRRSFQMVISKIAQINKQQINKMNQGRKNR